MPRRRPSDKYTLDLFSWVPPIVCEVFEEIVIRASTLRNSVSKAVSLSLKECGKSREQVAKEIGDYLGEDCPKNMLDTYASQGREDHTISLLRFIGLIAVTRDIRLLNLIANLFGWAVIDKKYLPAIEEAICADKIEELQQRKAAARKTWKGS